MDPAVTVTGSSTRDPLGTHCATSRRVALAIKTKLTTINGAANDIAPQVDDLRSELITPLDTVESLLKRGTDDRLPLTPKACLVQTLAKVS